MRALVLGVALLMGLMMTACGEKEPIRIGFIGGLSGRTADLGVAGRNGVMLAVEERNAAGGINGRPLELLVKDDEQNPEMGARRCAELLAVPVVAIVGPMTSGMAKVMIPLADAARIPMVSPTVTSTDFNGRDDYFFRVASDTTGYAGKNARYQVETLGHRRAAAIYDLGNQSFTESWLRDFRTEFEGGGGVVTAVETFVSGVDLAFFEKVAALLDSRPELVLVIANAVDAAQICQQVRKLAPTMSITMADWAATERFMELAGKAAEGVFVTQYLDRNHASPRFQAFRRAYRDRYGQEPGFAGLAGYDAAVLVLEGLSRQRPGQDLKEALLNLGEVPGAQQVLRFNPLGEAQRKTFVTVVRDGAYVTLE